MSSGCLLCDNKRLGECLECGPSAPPRLDARDGLTFHHVEQAHVPGVLWVPPILMLVYLISRALFS